MNLYEFMVEDDEGFWGSIQQWADTEDVAREKCREFLISNDVPRGTLAEPFTLTLVTK